MLGPAGANRSIPSASGPIARRGCSTSAFLRPDECRKAILDGYDLAGGGLNGRNHAGKGAFRHHAVVAVRRQVADCRGWVRRKTALAQEDGRRRASRICRCAPKPTCIIGGGLGRPSIVEAAKAFRELTGGRQRAQRGKNCR